jgi:hypothetical protein
LAVAVDQVFYQEVKSLQTLADQAELVKFMVVAVLVVAQPMIILVAVLVLLVSLYLNGNLK